MRVDVVLTLFLVAFLIPAYHSRTVRGRKVASKFSVTNDAIPVAGEDAKLFEQISISTEDARIPDHDMVNLRIYTLPVGQGSAHVIQCPDGDLTIFDLGSCRIGCHWGAANIRNFLTGHMNKIKNVVISHQHTDHTNLLHATFPNINEIQNLSNIYISCRENQLQHHTNDWINDIGARHLVREVNNGEPCGFDNELCTSAVPLNICPQDTARPRFEADVIWGNEECRRPTPNNRESLVVKIEHKMEDGTSRPVSVLLPGDIEQTGRLEAYHGLRLASTAYIFSHHGSTHGNTEAFMRLISPEVVFASGDPYYHYTSGWGHPHCGVIELLLYGIGSVCSDNPQNCLGTYLYQDFFLCGYNGNVFNMSDTDNYAIFTTILGEHVQDLLTFETEGFNWWAGSQPVVRGAVELDACDDQDHCAEDEP